MTDLLNRAKLAQKINKIAKAIGKVENDGLNKFDHYKYVSYEQLNALLRDLLEEHQLCIIPEIKNHTEDNFTTANGKGATRTVVVMEFLLIDTETGYTEVRKWAGADQDTKGKSFGQAVTEAQKRFELKLFHVSSKGESDPDSKTVEGAPFKKKKSNPTLEKVYAEMKNLNVDMNTMEKLCLHYFKKPAISMSDADFVALAAKKREADNKKSAEKVEADMQKAAEMSSEVGEQ